MACRSRTTGNNCLTAAECLDKSVVWEPRLGMWCWPRAMGKESGEIQYRFQALVKAQIKSLMQEGGRGQNWTHPEMIVFFKSQVDGEAQNGS